LPSVEVRRLFDAIREVRDSGTAVLYVSHRLDEIFEIADYVTVMRGGRIVDERPVAEITPRELASLIAGQDTDQARRYQPASTSADSSAVFQVRNLTATSLFGVDLEVNRGEIVGVAGLLGSGRDELPYAAAGARREASASWTVDGRQVDRLDVSQALKLGVALVPGDRGRESIVRDFTVLENLSLAMLPRLGTAASLNHRSERRQALEWMRRFDVDEGQIDRPIAVLSGGNQQKVVLARWLWSEPKVLILSEPTAGVDVGSRQSLYEILRAQAETGLAVLVCSSDVEDLVAVSNRVLVLRGGRIVQELSGDQLTTGAIVSATEGADG
jgi:ribose transport system ATP-binding protein